MKVLYDHQAMSIQEYGGVSGYFSQLWKAFQKLDNIDYSIALRYSNNVNFSDRDSFLKEIDFKGKKVLLENINRFFSNRELRKRDFDIFHPTFYYYYFKHSLYQKPYVVTIHDMIQEIFPGRFDFYDNIKKHKRNIALNADGIIAVSENTKRDIIKFYNIDEEMIKVIYHGYTAQKKISENAVKIRLPENYILYVGTRNRYKNFRFFISAISEILTKSDLFLVCAGGNKFSKEETIQITNLNLHNRIIQIPIIKGTLSVLYKNAMFLAVPSLYEGFGLPVLEAFGHNCPVVLSNTSSLPEIAKGAAKYFDPQNKDSIIETILEISNNKTLREELKVKGSERLKSFSWEKTANETIDFYYQIISNR